MRKNVTSGNESTSNKTKEAAAQSNPQYHYTAIYDDNGDFVDLAYEAIYPDPQEAAARL